MERLGNSTLQTLEFSLQPLDFVSAAGWENVAEIISKFGGADQLHTAVNQLQSQLYAT
jgi:hypothetical protein